MLGEQHAARCRVVNFRHRLAFGVFGDVTALDLGVQGHGLRFKGVQHLVDRAEHHAFAGFAVVHHRQVVETQHDVLRRHDDRLAVRGMQDVVRRHHQDAGFQLRFERQRNVDGHLVAVEIGVEGSADQRVKLDRFTFDQLWLERLDAETVQRRCTVQHHRMLANDLIEHVPDFGLLLLDELLRLLHGCSLAERLQTRVDERLEQLERHLLRQAALMQFQLGSDDDDRTARIVDALAQEVLTEAALLALQHVGQRLQRALVGTRNDATATAVVEQGVDGFLQHPLLVTDDDVRRAQLHQPLQAVVAVDDAAIEVVEIRGRKTSAIERNERTQFRRDDRNLGQDHPFRLVAALHEGFNDLQALAELLRLQLRRRLGDFLTEIDSDLRQVHRGQEFADRLSADAGGEGVGAILIDGLVVLLFRQELALGERRRARLDDDVILEIENALEILERHIHQKADARRQRLQEPDVRDRSRKLDVAHALAANLRERHLDAALFADQALVLHALVLAAQALVVLDRSEDAGAEQPVPLRLEGAVVDRLGFLDLTVGPGQDVLRRGDRDPDLIENRSRRLRFEDVGDFVHRLSPRGLGGGGQARGILVVVSYAPPHLR